MLFEECHQNKKKSKMASDMRSVPDPTKNAASLDYVASILLTTVL